jgi:hypothetical protein
LNATPTSTWAPRATTPACTSTSTSAGSRRHRLGLCGQRVVR